QRKIARAVYRKLALGSPVRDTKVAAEVGIPIEDVRATLDGLSGVYRDENDSIIGFWGLSIAEMPHRLLVNQVNLYAWCAWDTLFLPAILNAVARVESKDPANGQTIRLTVTPEGVSEQSHPEIAVSFLVPNGPFEGDVIMSFCHYVHFFTDAKS